LGDSSGNCKPAVLNGVYAQSVAVTGSNTVQLAVTVTVPGTYTISTNTVQVAVTVTVPGTYTISTNTVNGVSFSATGTFNSIGSQVVALQASGTPINSGSQAFTVMYGTSQCAFSINFATVATGSLGGGGGSCTPFVFAGTFQQGIALNNSNFVQIQVTVATLGGYNITSNTVNGVSFSQSGVFTATGLQNVTLTGTGTPANAGPQNFSITFGAGTCNFSIPFLTGVAPSNDYFPLSLNSNWTYADSLGGASILQKVINYAPGFGSQNYQTIAKYLVSDPNNATDSFYYRKPGGDYYQYVNFSRSFGFDNPVYGEFIFLKDNVAAGTTWQSSTLTGTMSGVPISFYAKMTLLAKAVPVSLGGFPFDDVIKVKYEYFVTGSPVVVFSMERWFAKNSGEIYNSTTISGTTTQLYRISNFIIF
jgi:hypothetical protein